MTKRIIQTKWQTNKGCGISKQKTSCIYIYITKNNPKIIKKTLSNYTSVKLEKYFFSVQYQKEKIWKKFSKRYVRLVHQKL